MVDINSIKKSIITLIGIIFLLVGSYFVIDKLRLLISKYTPTLDPVWYGVLLLVIGGYIIVRYYFRGEINEA